MAKYRKIDPVIWNDKKFNSLSVQGKLAFVFVLTHPHMTSVGAMRSSLVGLASELTGVTEKAFRESFDKDMLKADEKACFVWAPKFLKFNPPESPNVVKAWVSALDLVPECDMKDQLILHIKGFLEGLHEGFLEGFLKAYGKPWPIQEQEQEQEQDKTILCGNSNEISTCPYQKIIDLYHSILPELPKVKVLSDERKKAIKARWLSGLSSNGHKSHQIEYWDGFFNFIRSSPFLMGQVEPSPGRRHFIADMDFIFKKSNFIKIVEGKYHK